MKKKPDNKKSFVITIIALAAVAIIFVVGNFIGIKTELNDTSIQISAFSFKENIEYSEIEEVTYYERLDFGRRTNGADFISIKAGSFNNELFSSYKGAFYSSADCAISIKKTDGKYVVINEKSVEATKQLYDQIQNHLK